MQRQVVTRCPRTGRTVWVYQDEGPQKTRPHVPEMNRRVATRHGLTPQVNRGRAA